MGLVLYFLVVVALNTAFFRWLIPKSDRRFMIVLVLATLPVQLATLVWADNFAQFIDYEQDSYRYFANSQRIFASWTDYFNIAATVTYGYADSVGGLYLHLLTIVYQFGGANTMLYKTLNLACLWPTIFCWFCIAKLMAGTRFARLTAVVIAWTIV